MFTGIVETVGKIVDVGQEATNTVLSISASFLNELYIDQSIAHNGVCLTVTAIEGKYYTVTVINETKKCSNLGDVVIGDKVNLERCMPANGRFDGHIVQGHVDQQGVCEKIEDEKGSWKFWFSYDEKGNNITVGKGSICINGVSLTVVDSQPGTFSVAIIPYTYEHTNFSSLKIGDKVNLEFDILGKYIQKIMASS